MDLKGRVAVVTGAGSGLGQGLAVALARESMSLVLAGRRREALEATAERVEQHCAACLCVPADVSRLEDVQRLADAALERFGAVHLLCNNAGVGPFGMADETPMSEWQRVLSIDLWGPIHGVHVFLPILEQQGVGHICTTASEAGLYATRCLAAYNTAKFGVVGLMQSVARDLRAKTSPVTASVVCPGSMKTDMLRGAREHNAGTPAPKSPVLQDFERTVARAVQDGMDPLEAAKIVVAAIKKDQFWIFTHARVPETALRQATAMTERNVLIDL